MTKWIAVLLSALVLAGCGGGDEGGEAGALKFAERMRAMGVTTASQTATTSATAEMTLDWAEYKFSELFPKDLGAHFPSIDYQGVTYNARAYSGAWGTRYLGITPDGRIFGLGDFTGEALQQFNDINHWSSQVLAEKCKVYPGSCPNLPPMASAGVAQNVEVGTLALLDGSASSDANGDQLTYTWTLSRKPVGSMATLASPNSVKPTFTADIAGTYLVSLEVSDGQITSEASTVRVVAAVANAAPMANAGADMNVRRSSTVTLDGRGSSDANGDSLTYQWALISRPAGSLGSLDTPTASRPTLLADEAGTYVISLVVSDGRLSNAATVTVTAVSNFAWDNVAPNANAGPSQHVTTGAVVKLDGSASSDANIFYTLTYAWTLTSRPEGSVVTLSNPTTARPTFTADVAGSYVATLIVSDGELSSAAATVTLTAVTDFTPTANAGVSRSVVPGVAVVLNGSGSTSAGGYPLSYVWKLVAAPAGSQEALTNSTSATPSLSTDVAGDYVVSLVVNDGVYSSDPNSITITAVSELNQLLGRSGSKSTSSFNGVLQPGSQFTSTIVNSSEETFALTKYELQNGGVVVSSSVDRALLSDGSLAPAEAVGLTSRLSAASADNGFRAVYYLTLTRTGQSFTMVVDF